MKTIFQEQGVTIVSILSALCTIITAIVGWVFRGTDSSTTAATPSGRGGTKDSGGGMSGLCWVIDSGGGGVKFG